MLESYAAREADMHGTLRVAALLLATAGLLLAESGAPADTLGTPAKLTVGGKPIEVDSGHGDPFVCDWDGDGLPDLLVGQFGSGRLLIYRNIGTRKEPRLGEPTPFRAGGAEGTVPSG